MSFMGNIRRGRRENEGQGYQEEVIDEEQNL